MERDTAMEEGDMEKDTVVDTRKATEEVTGVDTRKATEEVTRKVMGVDTRRDMAEGEMIMDTEEDTK